MEMQEDETPRIGMRSEPRTNMFVMASMSSSSVSGPVKIRNLSEHGALIESAQLPAVGEMLELRRGEILVSGRVVWRLDGKAGLQLDGPVTPTDWMPAGHAGQAAVDSTFQNLKTGVGTSPVSQAAPSTGQPSDPTMLRRTADSLDALADSLAEDSDVVARHASELQVLDIASQTLRKLARPH